MFSLSAIAALPQGKPGLVYGDYEPIDEGSDWLYAYRRWSKEGEFTSINFSSKEQTNIPFLPVFVTRLFISNYEAGCSSFKGYFATLGYQGIGWRRLNPVN